MIVVPFMRRKYQRPITRQPDFAALRHVEKLLISEHEAAMADFVISNSNPVSAEQSAVACERAIVAMRRLGAFLKSREIPEDLVVAITQDREIKLVR